MHETQTPIGRIEMNCSHVSLPDLEAELEDEEELALVTMSVMVRRT